MKKNLIMAICTAFVIVGLVVSLIFVFGGKNEQPLEVEMPEIKGTWTVVAYYTNDTPVLLDGQFAKITDSEIIMYDGKTAEKRNSYTINEVNQLVLKESAKIYKLDYKTENCLRLYDSATTYLLLMRNSSDDYKSEVVDLEVLAGRWDIVMKGDLNDSGDVLVFENNTLKYFKNSLDTPTAIADITLKDNKLSVAAMNLNMNCYKINDITVGFVENNGIVWEISKSN